MERLIALILAHPRAWIASVLCATVAFAFGVPKVGIDSSGSMLMIPDAPDRIYYDEVRETFGDDVILSIVIKTEDVFQPAILQSIEDLTADTEDLPGVNSVVSLATVSNIRGQDGILETDQLVPSVPEETSELEKIKSDALYSEAFRGEVISRDGKTAAVNLFVAEDPDDHHFNDKLTSAVQSLIDREAAILGSEVEIYQTGMPQLKVTMMDFIKKDMMRLLPVSFVVVFLTLFILYRSLAAVLIPVVTGMVSIVITVGFMGFLGIDFNPVTCIIPLLLVVVGATEDMHLLSEYGLALARGETKQEAIRSMMDKGGLAVFLTSLTTFFGFATIVANAIPVLRGFGIAASFGMLANFVVTIILVPHLLSWLREPTKKASSTKENVQPIAAAVARIPSRRRLLIVGVSALVAIIGVLSSRNIEVDTDYLGFFHEEAEIRKSFSDISEHLAGAHSFYVVIDTKREDGLKDPQVLKEIAALADFVEARTDKVSGFPNLIRMTHREINDGDPAFYQVPDEADLIAQYSLMLNQDDLDRFVDSEFSKTCLLVRTQVSGSNELRQLTPKIEGYAADFMTRELDVKITGEMILVADASDRIAKGIVGSLLLLLAAVLAVIAVLFWSLKAGLLALVPNVLPVLVNFGTMGILGYALGPGTFPVAMIAFGIAVDDTIHFMVRYYKELKSSESEVEAVEKSVEKEFRPVFASTLALVLGFLVLTFSEFGSTYQFGILAAVSLLAALCADLFLTPVIFLMSPLITAWDYLNLKISGDSLHESQLFKGLKISEIKRVALAGQFVHYEEGDAVISKGDEGRDVFFVVEGSAEVMDTATADSGKSLESVHSLSRGDLFGEMSFISKEPRSATVVATKPLDLIRIDESVLERIRVRHPKIAAKLFFNFSYLLSDRLRKLMQTQRD